MTCTIPALVAAIQFLAPEIASPKVEWNPAFAPQFVGCSANTWPAPTELARLECELAMEKRRLAEHEIRNARLREIAELLKACR